MKEEKKKHNKFCFVPLMAQAIQEKGLKEGWLFPHDFSIHYFLP